MLVSNMNIFFIHSSKKKIVKIIRFYEAIFNIHSSAIFHSIGNYISHICKKLTWLCSSFPKKNMNSVDNETSSEIDDTQYSNYLYFVFFGISKTTRKTTKSFSSIFFRSYLRSSALRICICIKYASLWLQDGQGAIVLSTFSLYNKRGEVDKR